MVGEKKGTSRTLANVSAGFSFVSVHTSFDLIPPSIYGSFIHPLAHALTSCNPLHFIHLSAQLFTQPLKTGSLFNHFFVVACCSFIHTFICSTIQFIQPLTAEISSSVHVSIYCILIPCRRYGHHPCCSFSRAVCQCMSTAMTEFSGGSSFFH